MGLTGNEVSAVNEQRRNEELSESPVGRMLESGSALAGAGVALGTSLVAGNHVDLAMAGSVVAGMRIVGWFRKLGTSKVNENLEALGQATEDALERVEEALLNHGVSIDEIKERLESQAFRDSMANASLQALRTTQKERLKRLALILANGVKEGDASTESTDDMMRAAVELTRKDIFLLEAIYVRQQQILSDAQKFPMQWYDNVRSDWQKWVVEDVAEYRQGTRSFFELKASLSRLAAFGFIIAVPPIGTSNSPGADPYAILLEGKEFYERLQQIGGGG